MKKIPIIVLIVLAVMAGLLYLFIPSQKKQRTVTNDTLREQLGVSSQTGRDKVIIDTAILLRPGFLIIRGSDGKRVGQIVEISRYLNAGEHKNIEISLGEFYTYNESDQLIAMIYHDDGDGSFSELDQPSPTSPAIFIKSGAVVPPSVFKEEVVMDPGSGMITIRYTNTGFQPARLTVPVGTMVEFINQSDVDMWVASNDHPGHELLPTFDQFKGEGKGKNYMYVFDKKGEWKYHDHLNPSFEGTITVE